MPTNTKSTDGELQHRVRVELAGDPRVDATELTASVIDGVVTLGGYVDSFAKRVAALHAVHRIVGVLDVADEIQVRPAHTKSDRDIVEAVRAALIWDAFVPDQRITSTVSAGWVTLGGTVDRLQQREDAAQAVERLSGIRGVTNEILVVPAEVDVCKLRGSIEDALARRARREARRIEFCLADGTVTLSGYVDSWAEKNAVGQLVGHSPGVKHVVNDIRVDPYS